MCNFGACFLYCPKWLVVVVRLSSKWKIARIFTNFYVFLRNYYALFYFIVFYGILFCFISTLFHVYFF